MIAFALVQGLMALRSLFSMNSNASAWNLLEPPFVCIVMAEMS